MTDQEWIQKHAKDEVQEAFLRLAKIVGQVSQGADLTYDAVNDTAEFLKVAAGRLKP